MAQNNQTGEGSGGQKPKLPTGSAPTLEEIMDEVDPHNQIDGTIKQALASLGEDFIDLLARGACRVARSRNATTVEAADVENYLNHHLELFSNLSRNEEAQPEQTSKTADTNKKEAEK